MPIHRITQGGKTYYRWGDHGKMYTDRKDAEKQAAAAHANGYKEPTNKPKQNKRHIPGHFHILEKRTQHFRVIRNENRVPTDRPWYCPIHRK